MADREENAGIPSGDEEEVIRYYFKCGYEYSAIAQFLEKFHNITRDARIVQSL